MNARSRVILSLMVLAAAALSLTSVSCRGKGAEQAASGAAAKRVPVNVTPARTMTFETRLVTSGSLMSKNYALVSARIPGTLDLVFVDEGDRVVAGETKLFQTDSANLTKAVEIARQALAVADSAIREAEANRERAAADFNKARIDYERFKRLYEQDQAVTKNAFESQESRFLQTQAALKFATVSVEVATGRRDQARSNVAIAEKDLADSLVKAPLSGVVVRRLREPGEMAAAGTPVLRIEDPSLIEASAFLPSEVFADIVVGKTEMRVRSGAVDLGTRPVSYKSPTADLKLRTFEVKCEIPQPPAGVAPGLLADVSVVTVRREGLGVPAGAVQHRGGLDVVFVVDSGGAVQAVPVTTGLETDGWIEVVKGGLKKDDRVVSRGQQLISEGSAVDVLEEGR